MYLSCIPACMFAHMYMHCMYVCSFVCICIGILNERLCALVLKRVKLERGFDLGSFSTAGVAAFPFGP